MYKLFIMFEWPTLRNKLSALFLIKSLLEVVFVKGTKQQCRSGVTIAILPTKPKWEKPFMMSHMSVQIRFREVAPKLVQLLTEWTETFPYDFRDERMMRCLKDMTHHVARGDEVGVMFFSFVETLCEPLHATSSQKQIHFNFLNKACIIRMSLFAPVLLAGHAADDPALD